MIGMLINDALPKHLHPAMWIALDAPQRPAQSRKRKPATQPRPGLSKRVSRYVSTGPFWKSNNG